ncbi:AbrB family transcriptional regulator [Lentzea sp. NPDC102401]|uniref:AbrB family transcriptional regulator n=1 Tax=Lentzea sp. NPDC102401 TaxID=3364128 RepID=UPI003827394C
MSLATTDTGSGSALRETARGVPRIAIGLALTGVCIILGRAGEALGLPAPQLVIATVMGAATAALSRAEHVPSAWRTRTSHALIGVLMGSYLHPETLARAADVVLSSLAATVATIGVCVLAAMLLARVSTVSTLDALLGLTPGGSASIIASATELGADAWHVAFAQYLRVALVALTAPLLVISVSTHAQNPSRVPTSVFVWPDMGHLVERPNGASPLLVLTAVCVLGTQLGNRLRLPAPALLGAAVLTVVVTFTGTARGFAPDGLLEETVLVLTGLEAGRHFSRTRLRRSISVLPHLIGAIVAVCVACTGIAWVFGALTGVGFTHAYLATTPGGITAVLATATSTGTDMTVVSTAQCVRLFVVALVVPLLIRGLKRWQSRNAGSSSGTTEHG